MKKIILTLTAFVFMFFLYGCSDDDPQRDLCSNSSLNAAFNFDAFNNTVGTSMGFTDASTGDKSGVTYLWDFGDNTTSSESNPKHTYSTPGQYTVKLTVRNSCNVKSDAIPRTVNIISRPTQKVLPMYRVGQQTMVWCWAACSEMILNYYQRPTPQCYILSTWFNADCCTFPMYCKTTGTLGQISANLEYFGGLQSTVKNGTLTISEIANEIANNRPIIIAYTNFQSGHVVVIFGYDLTTQSIYIYDPFYYNVNNPNYAFVVPYTTTLTYSGTQQWTNTIYRIGY